MEEKEIHLRDYWRVISKRKVTVYTFFLITFVVVALATLTATPEYLASTKILVEKNESTGLEFYYYYAQQDPEFLATQNQIITSKRVVLKAVRLLNLEKEYGRYFPNAGNQVSFVKTLSNQVKGWVSDLKAKIMPAATTAAPSEQLPDDSDEMASLYSDREKEIAGSIMGAINVAPVKESKVFELSFMSESPQLAKRVANALAKAYREELLEIKMSSSGYTIQWMTKKVEEEREKLEKSEISLQQFKKDHDLVTVEDRMAVTPQKLVEFGSQLSQAEGKRKEVEALYEQIRRVGASSSAIDSIPAIANNVTIQALHTQIIEAERKVTEFSKKYGEKHPLMIKAVSERNSMIAKKNQEVRRVVDSVRRDFELAQANEDSLRNLLAKTKAETIGMNEKFGQYEILKKEVDLNRTIYDALISRLKEQDITEKTQDINVWVIEEASTPRSPAKPDKKRNLLLGLVLGLFGGVGLAFFIEYLDNTVKTPEDAEEHLGLPILGVVGSFEGKGKKSCSELIPLGKDQSVIAENYRTLRTSVLLSSAGGPPASIVITSMLPGEGKTVTAVNLALTIAHAGKRVLLVDGDMRRSRIHKILNLQNQKGLSTFLAGASSLDLAQKGSVETLQVITSGPLPPNPSELLSSPKLVEFLAAMKSEFDIVVFDTPPIISVSDTLVLGKIVDGVIMVTRAGTSTYEATAKGIKVLSDLQVRILGLVVNDFDPKNNKYYYGKYYQQYYGDYSQKAS
ncbi:MAG: polysaccharide biosynthesis tyrosine autokinase [Desulfobulbaceae bacterium]|nr:polysaccharide biosynthesis tyrosine autokinase [Desulfobulbaceae bacterium]